MSGPVREAHHLVLDGGAIARPRAPDPSGIDGRFAEIGAHQRVRFRRRRGHMADRLRHGYAVGHGGERRRRVVTPLLLKPVEGDAAPVEARRRAGLEAAHRQAEPLQPAGEADGRRVAHPAGRPRFPADMDHAAQESAGGQHDGPRSKRLPARQRHARDPPLPVQNEVLHRARAQRQAGLLLQQGLYRAAVEPAVRLGARPLHGRALAAVEHAKLDAGPVDGAAHDAVQRVDLAHQMALAEPADGRVAGHLADGVELVGDQQRPRPSPRRRRRRLAARMAAADHDDIEPAHGPVQ